MVGGLELKLALEALSTIGESVKLSPEEFRSAGIDPEDGQQRARVDEVDLVIELVAKVAGLQDELLVENVLVDANVVGTGAQSLDRLDVIGVDGCCVAS